MTSSSAGSTAGGQLQFRPKFGILCMLTALCILGSTDAVVKWSAGNIPVIQIAFVRFALSLVIVLVLIRRSPNGFGVLRTRRPIEHLLRGFCSTFELLAFYLAISKIPLPTAMSIVSTSPIFGTLLGVIVLRERLRLGGWIAIMAGFLGMLLVVQPEEGVGSVEGTVAVLTSVVLWSTAQLLARRLSATESNDTILFYYAVVGTLLMGAALPFVWVQPTGLEWLALGAIGVLGCLGQYLLILAFRFAPLSLVAPFEYSALIWASLYGWIFWGDVLGPVALAGVVVIVGACLYISRNAAH
ncbi:MAG TPA: DMT family transporter [Alphaproteobacteria bacterium]|nr:DMT family transporter [Alphaproteobacteria bacterium]